MGALHRNKESKNCKTVLDAVRRSLIITKGYRRYHIYCAVTLSFMAFATRQATEITKNIGWKYIHEETRWKELRSQRKGENDEKGANKWEDFRWNCYCMCRPSAEVLTQAGWSLNRSQRGCTFSMLPVTWCCAENCWEGTCWRAGILTRAPCVCLKMLICLQ